MELRHLRYFVAVAEEMNIHRAAERLNISQPPLSVTIQQLEEELEVKLFAREGRGIQITRAGLDFLNHAKSILSNVKEASHRARDVEQGIKGVLKVGFISSAVTGILQNIVSAYRVKYPDVKLDLVQSVGVHIGNKVIEGTFDVGIVRYPIKLSNDLVVQHVSKESWYVALPSDHSLAKKKQLTFQDLDKKDMIFYPRWNAPEGYDDIIRMFAKHNVSPNIVLETSQQMSIAGLVGSGIALAIVPECMSNITVPNVVHRPLQDTKNTTGFALVMRKQNDALVSHFIELANSTKF